jgi:enolase
MVERLLGKGVLNAVKNVNTIIDELVGTSVFEQNLIDQTMIDLDGTANKSNLGANAILGVFLLLQKQPNELGLPLYIDMLVVFRQILCLFQ